MIFTASDVSSLARSLEHWEWAEYASCALVALGCTGEYIAEFTDHWTGGIKERKDRLARRSTLILISALALELVCLVKTNSISGLLIGSLSEKASVADIKSQSAIEKSSLAENKASEADTSAGEAKHKADLVAKQADALEMRTKAASRKLTELGQDILAEGPRWRLLKNGEDTFVKALKPFVGQKVTIVTCANDDTERFAFEEMILDLFRKAGWDNPGWTRWDQCPIRLSGGNVINFVSTTGNPSVRWAGTPAGQWIKPAGGENGKTAGDALTNVLHKLKIFSFAYEERPVPGATMIARQAFGDGSPAEMALNDPDRIFLLVGPNAPMFANEQRHPNKKANLK